MSISNIVLYIKKLLETCSVSALVVMVVDEDKCTIARQPLP